MIIGLSGLIGSGKGTVAQCLVDEFGFRQDSFAASLKDACAVLFDWPRHLLEGDTLESRQWREVADEWWSKKLGISNFTPRYALQHLGTNVLRSHFNDNLWFLTLENRLRKNSSQNIVISDVRFNNEYQFIRDQGGIIIQINRGKKPEWFDVAANANLGNDIARYEMETIYKHVHPSEWSWAGQEYDFEINNNESITDLNTRISNIIKDVMAR